MSGQSLIARKSTLQPLLTRTLFLRTTTRSTTAAATRYKKAEADAHREVKKAKAPPSTLSIQTVVRHGLPQLRTPTTPSSAQTAGAAIREVGVTRRVFLLNPYLTTDEIHGLAYRIDLLGRNTAINSVLIATTDDDDVAHGAMPTCVIDTQKELESPSSDSDPVLDYVDGLADREAHWHVCGGYDAHALYTSGATQDAVEVERLLEGLRRLALAARGGPSIVASEGYVNEEDKPPTPFESRIPVITVPHGLINDGGYALCMGSYVLATRESTVKFLNPWKGLSLDPIGLSFVLPRLGWEYRQPSAQYPVGMMLALTGYEADAFDMVETGLATHYIDSPTKVGYLEKALGSYLLPWDQQGLYRKRKKLHGQKDEEEDFVSSSGSGGNQQGAFRGRRRRSDPNDKYRNVTVANLLFSISEFEASGKEFMADVEKEIQQTEDPSLVLGDDRFVMNAPRTSAAVNISATFAEFFTREKTVEGILERLKEVAATHLVKDDVEERECGQVADALATKMESACPLALKVVHKSMILGSKSNETLESCMKREMNVQKKMLMGQDFEEWAKDGGSLEQGGFRRWKHASLKDVSNDEVEEILSNK